MFLKEIKWTMVSVCELSFKVMMFLTVAVNRSEADKSEICLKQTALDGLTRNVLRCEDGVIQLLCFKYGEKQCCKLKSDCAANFQECLEYISNECTGQKSCSLPKPEEYKDDRGKEEECEFMTVTGIEYTCTEDGKALPPTCSSGNTGDREETSMVIIPIIAVLAALIITAVILGVVLYRRRSRTKRKNTSNPKTHGSSKGEDNAGLEDEYNTIPADYEEMPHNSYHTLDKTKADTEHAYSNKSRDNSMKYSTIVLAEDTEIKMNAYGYDRTSPKIRYKANELKDLESVHSYGHFSDTPDDYNKVNTNLNKHNTDKDYSHFESEPSSDYSHLHDKDKALQRKPSNDYNHLQSKTIPNRPIKSADNYEQPVFKDRNDVLLSEPHARTDVYETSVENPTSISRNGKIKRKDSYEEPVLISTPGRNDVSNYETKVNVKVRDDYETPVKFKDTSVDNIDVSMNTRVKRKDSYEIPVLKNTDVFNSEQKVVSETTDNYEAPLSLRDSEIFPQNAEIEIPNTCNKPLKRNDSYETPILKTQ